VSEIFVIAEEELVIAFRMIGVEGEAATGSESAQTAFRRVMDSPGECKMLILAEDIADMLGSELIDWQLSGRYPLVVELPPLSGSIPGHIQLGDAVRQAIGIKIQ
jgi:V/A-type H+-transporting ATPase subunit F